MMIMNETINYRKSIAVILLLITCMCHNTFIQWGTENRTTGIPFITIYTVTTVPAILRSYDGNGLKWGPLARFSNIKILSFIFGILLPFILLLIVINILRKIKKPKIT